MNQVSIKYAPREILKVGDKKANPEYDVVPQWAYSQLTNRDKLRMGKELDHLYENEPTEIDEETQLFFFYYRDIWMEMTLKFMVDRGIDWTGHPRYTGDYVDEEEEMVMLFYEEDMKYLENLNPEEMTTNEEKLVDQINTIGDFATCPEEAGSFPADEDSAPETDDENVGLVGGARKIEIGNVLGRKTEWIYRKAEKAGIGKAVLRAGGRKKELSAMEKGHVPTGSRPLFAGIGNRPYTKFTDVLSDQEREMIARERHDKTAPRPLLEKKKHMPHKLPCCVCHADWRDWLKKLPLSRKNAMTHPPNIKIEDGILLIPSEEDAESDKSDHTLVEDTTEI